MFTGWIRNQVSLPYSTWSFTSHCKPHCGSTYFWVSTTHRHHLSSPNNRQVPVPHQPGIWIGTTRTFDMERIKDEEDRCAFKSLYSYQTRASSIAVNISEWPVEPSTPDRGIGIAELGIRSCVQLPRPWDIQTEVCSSYCWNDRLAWVETSLSRRRVQKMWVKDRMEGCM